MKKTDLINSVVEICAENGVTITKGNTSKVIDAIVSTIVDTVASGEEVAISGLGKFVVAERGPREGRNPATGEAIHIEASKLPKFKASQNFKAAVKGV